MRPGCLCAATILAVALLVSLPAAVSAEMRMDTGVVPHSRIPAPIMSDAVVRLDVPHIRQERDLCVPTSSAMILKYFGEAHDPRALKRLAEEHKPPSKRNTTFTYWNDMQHALRAIGKRWAARKYPRTEAGLEQGLVDIRHSLRAGNPVMIDVHLGRGHTFVVMGYDHQKKVVYVRDPTLAGSLSRILSYRELLDSWHNHKFDANSRSAFFSQR